MRRATLADAPALATIINDPTIRPHIGGGEGFLDPSALLEDCNTVCLFDEGGGQLFQWRGPGIYEAHSFYLVRGRAALDRGAEAIRRMFADHGAEMVWRATPLSNRAARWFNRKLGFRSRGEIEVPHYGRCELFELRGTECL